LEGTKMTQSKSLGKKDIKFGESHFSAAVIQDMSGNFRLRDGRPVKKIDETTYEYEAK